MKRKKIFLLTAVILLAVIGILLYHKDHKKTEILRSSSEDERYQLVIYQIGDVQFPFGPGKCEIVLYEENKKIGSKEVVLYNDGKKPDEDNFMITWHTDSVEILVRAEEMDDLKLVFEIQ